ncbi:MAG: polyprenyl synthetase family protein [Desulfuromonadales bacterium]|nr:polyprenyl synthetase family protein [Desulfuromonadales bacterium]
MTEQDLPAYLAACVERVDQALHRWLPAEDLLPQQLHQAMRYSVFAGGKRLRPVLMIAAAEAVGGRAEQVLAAASALEMIHTYSLIHDDLPAMDDDDFRRGRPTSHKVYGEATAILAGDALLTEAFRLLADPIVHGDTPDGVRLRVLEIVARCAGSRGMVGGQMVDMRTEGAPCDQPTLEYIHTRKTGALILAAVQTGALLAGADEASLADLTRYAEAAGLAFQVADDVLDVVGDQQKLGKAVGADQARGKATYPALFGLDGARERAGELCAIAVDSLIRFGPEADPLRLIARYMVERTS